jgi:hypothetical protein
MTGGGRGLSGARSWVTWNQTGRSVQRACRCRTIRRCHRAGLTRCTVGDQVSGGSTGTRFDLRRPAAPPTYWSTSSPRVAASIRRTMASALRARCVITCPTVHPGSNEGFLAIESVISMTASDSRSCACRHSSTSAAGRSTSLNRRPSPREESEGGTRTYQGRRQRSLHRHLGGASGQIGGRWPSRSRRSARPRHSNGPPGRSRSRTNPHSAPSRQNRRLERVEQGTQPVLVVDDGRDRHRRLGIHHGRQIATDLKSPLSACHSVRAAVHRPERVGPGIRERPIGRDS